MFKKIVQIGRILPILATVCILNPIHWFSNTAWAASTQGVPNLESISSQLQEINGLLSKLNLANVSNNKLNKLLASYRPESEDKLITLYTAIHDGFKQIPDNNLILIAMSILKPMEEYVTVQSQNLEQLITFIQNIEKSIIITDHTIIAYYKNLQTLNLNIIAITDAIILTAQTHNWWNPFLPKNIEIKSMREQIKFLRAQNDKILKMIPKDSVKLSQK